MIVAFGLIGLGVFCHVAAALLSGYFINRRLPGLIERSAMLPEDDSGRKLWEHTAGRGIVPRWTSILGLLGALIFAMGLLLFLCRWVNPVT